jgi:hypothetical protein
MLPVVFDAKGKPLAVSREAGLTDLKQMPVVETVMALMDDPLIPGGKAWVFGWSEMTRPGKVWQFGKTDGRLVKPGNGVPDRLSAINGCMYDHDKPVKFGSMKTARNLYPTVINDVFNVVADSFGAESATRVGMTDEMRIALNDMGKKVDMKIIDSPKALADVQKAIIDGGWAPVWCGSIEVSTPTK